MAVYSWPSCEVLVKIEWPTEERALWAIGFPGGPEIYEMEKVGRFREERLSRRHYQRSRPSLSEREVEGSLIVATSDASIKFHQIWPQHLDEAGRKVCKQCDKEPQMNRKHEMIIR